MTHLIRIKIYFENRFFINGYTIGIESGKKTTSSSKVGNGKDAQKAKKTHPYSYKRNKLIKHRNH